MIKIKVIHICSILFLTSFLLAISFISSDTYSQSDEANSVVSVFSVSATISEKTSNTFTIAEIKGDTFEDLESHTFSKDTLKLIRNTDDLPLDFNDIKVGDHIVVRGTFVDSEYVAVEIYDFTQNDVGTEIVNEPVSTSTASTTSETSGDISTSTEPVSNDSASTTDETADDVEVPATTPASPEEPSGQPAEPTEAPAEEATDEPAPEPEPAPATP